ncbi:MAG: sigma 54-interacting transcriptional regulator [Vicinamibacterales bacterium]
MLAMTSPETVSFSDTALLRMLSSRNHRPNLLIENRRASFESVLQQLTEVCEPPTWVCRFPGILDIRRDFKGTLVLGDIDRMTIGQQITLSDWLGRKDSDVQVVSVTRASMTELIEEGRFLEGLFFRLNTVTIRAVSLGDYCAAW